MSSGRIDLKTDSPGWWVRAIAVLLLILLTEGSDVSLAVGVEQLLEVLLTRGP